MYSANGGSDDPTHGEQRPAALLLVLEAALAEVVPAPAVRSALEEGPLLIH